MQREIFDLPATRRSAATARREVASTLRSWGLAELCADAELIVSELVTNAVLHAPGDISHELQIIRRDTGVRIIVTDGSAAPPVVRAVDDGRPGGGGIRIVASLAAAWGHQAHPGGKQVWADVDQQHDAQPSITNS